MRRISALILALGLVMLGTGAATFRAAPSPGTRAFLIVMSDMGIHYGQVEEECPQGLEMTVEEAYLATKTPEERERLLRPENAREYAKGWKEDFITGPGGENVCNNPKSFMKDARHPPYRGVNGKIAFGLNLDGTSDGRATTQTCAHQKFVGVNGEPSVDNQLYRAVGCSKLWRTVVPRNYSHIEPFLIELRGLDDPKNDDHVEVGIFSTEEAPLQGSDGKIIANQTLSITRNARWRTTVAARVVDGQLTTDVVEGLYLRQVLSTWGLFGEGYDFEFHSARFKMALQPDGTIAGVLGAYRPLDNIFTGGRCCKGTASTANNDCASEHKTLAQLADGYPDPVTGQCTMVSSASNLTGIPVFIARAG